MAFSSFKVGELAENEEGDFVAQITAIGKKPLRWMEVAISDYVTGLAKNMVSSGGASLEETGHYYSWHRVIKYGSDIDHVRVTANALCEYICSQLAELRRDYGAMEWNKLRAECKKEAAKSGDKTAKQLFDERRREREELQKGYLSEKKEREKNNYNGGDFMFKNEKIKICSKPMLPPCEVKKGATVVDEDGDLVAKVMRLDLSGDPIWVELAISEFSELSVETMRCYCADSSTTMEETGKMYTKVNRILRIESPSSRSLAITLDELCEFIRDRLLALREGGMTEEEWKRAQETAEFIAIRKGYTETAEQIMARYRKGQEAYEARYKAQREKRKERERREKQKERKTREARKRLNTATE